MAAGARPSFGVARPMKGGDSSKPSPAPMPGGGGQFPPLPSSDAMADPTGKNPLLDIASELERIALQDEYFITRKLYPNVDFYSGLIYQAMGFPVTMFPVMFAIPRTAGWIAQWEEMLLDPEQKIARPKQIYIGSARRDYVSREKRG